MNIKKKEGGFYASKVRQYLNEYSDVDLLEGFIRKDRSERFSEADESLEDVPSDSII